MMKHLLYFLLFFTFIHAAKGQYYNLIWSDEFNEGTLDLDTWTIETGTGVNGDFGTGQLDRATDRPENISFEDGVEGANDGCLKISTVKERYIDRNYTSGRINTKDNASWGPGHRIAARVWPKGVRHKGQGFAFWMMPNEIPDGHDYIMWPQGGEIDIMEYVGSIPFNNLGTVHYAWSWENNEWQSWNHGHLGGYFNYEKEMVPTPQEPGYGNYPPTLGDPDAGSTGFHIYGIDWYEDRIEFFVDYHVYHIHYFNDGGRFNQDGQDQRNVSVIDNRRVYESEYSNHFEEWQPFEHKFFTILSAGVGGSTNTYGGAIVPEAEFPCDVYIDWVRVYESTNVLSNDHRFENKISLFPNPVNDLLTFELDDAHTYSVTVSNLQGQVLFQRQLDPSGKVDLSFLDRGVYLIRASNGSMTLSKKIFKD